MRFRSLHLAAYGHFTDRTLEFPAGPTDLHVIFGANEAGKSTALTALGDLLFGMHPQSPYNFVHDYRAMRVAAEIEDGDGVVLQFQRRKGKKATLLDAAGEALPDDALARWLGAVDRGLFDRMFGLNHDGLRAGGSALLAAEGEVGRSLFQAGAAVADLGRLLRKLDGAAAEIFKPGGRIPALNAAIHQYGDLRKQIRDTSLKADDWNSLQTKKAGVQREREALATRQAETKRERNRLERIRRLAPRLAELRRLRDSLADLADAPLLPEDAASARDEAEKALATALHQLDSLQARMAEERAKLILPDGAEALAAVREDIDRLRQQVGATLKAEADLPTRRSELAHTETRMRALLRDLGQPQDLDRVEAVLPTRPQLAEIRTLAGRFSGVDHASRTARDTLTACSAALDEARVRLDAAPAPADPGPLRDAADDLIGCRELRRDVSERRDRLAAERTALDRRLERLGGWSGDLAALDGLAVPPAETIARHRDQADALDAKGDEADRAVRMLDTALAKLQARRAALEQGRPVPTEEAVRTVRAGRDDGWRLIRRRYIEGEPVEAPSPDAYEASVADADALADQRAADSAHVAAYEDACRQQAETAAEHRAAVAHRDAVRRERLAATQAWQALWAACGVEPASPREMIAWTQERAAILEAAGALAAQARMLDRDLGRVDAAARAVAAALDRPAQTPAAELERAAEAALRRFDTARRAHEQAVDTLRQAQRARDAAQDQLVKAEAEHAAWTDAWGRALAPLGHSEQTTVAAAGTLLDLYEELREAHGQAAGLRHRISTMTADIDAFATATADLVGRCAPDLAGLPSAQAVQGLEERSRAAVEAVNRRASARQALEKLDEERRRHEAARTEAQGDLDRLRQRAGAEDLQALRAAEERSARKRQATRDHAALEEAIVADADGLTLAEVEAECASIDPDRLRARLDELDDRAEHMTAEAGGLGETWAALMQQEQAMGGGSAAADAAQQRESVLAEIDGLSERYTALKLATLVLTRAIDDYRRRHQGPLLEAAGRTFRTLTRGSFDGFRTDYGDDDQPHLMGVRPDGTQVGVGGMSEGTRDQLFLALRLAAVEHYAASAGPMPFVADDLLVHFDDDRAAAAFAALATLAERTQVLFFTHNRHMVDIARATLGAERVRLHEL